MKKFVILYKSAAAERPLMAAHSLFHWKRAAALAFSLLFPCVAQAQYSDRATQQAVTLFRMSCMRFAGDAADLRSWISAHNLVRIPRPAADYFSPIKPAQAFWASTADGKLALSSADDGACAVLAEHGRELAFETELVGALQRDKVTVTPETARSRPGAMQQVLRASYGSRAWTLSITTKAYPEAPGQLPLVILLATKTPAA